MAWRLTRFSATPAFDTDAGRTTRWRRRASASGHVDHALGPIRVLSDRCDRGAQLESRDTHGRQPTLCPRSRFRGFSTDCFKQAQTLRCRPYRVLRRSTTRRPATNQRLSALTKARRGGALRSRAHLKYGAGGSKLRVRPRVSAPPRPPRTPGPRTPSHREEAARAVAARRTRDGAFER